MYEAYFGLRHRPFSPLPRVESFIPLAPVREPFEALVRCITQEQGIGVLTAPSGSGKSLVCRLLQHRFSDLRRTVLLTTARFPTRRALLQAILFELKHPFIGLSEQEARLRVLDLLQASPAPQNRMLLIIDEAHLLSSRGLEELRTLTDYEIAGTPCVSLILSGQLELEELLTEPEMNAFNQRVGCHVCIEPLTFEESAQYLRERLRYAGNDGLTIFTPEAVQLICSASEGNPRRLNQLSDHSLLLAYAEEQRPVDESIVRAALLDLRELPLHWNAPLDLMPDGDRNPLASFAKSYEAAAAAQDDEPQAESDTDIDLEEDSSCVSSDWHCNSAESSETEPSVFEVGSSLHETPIDELFQVTRFVVPGESTEMAESPLDPSVIETTPPAESHAFETTDSAAETVEMETETVDETVSMEASPELGFKTGGEWSFAPSPLVPPPTSIRPAEFEELVVDDAYAMIDRQLESQDRVLPRGLRTSVCQNSPASPDVSSTDALPSRSGLDEPPEEIDDALFEAAPISASMETTPDFEPPVCEAEPVLLESQVLDFINEISVDVHQFRLELEASRAETDPSIPSLPARDEASRPRYQSLRESLQWQFDVVEPEAAQEPLDQSGGEPQHEPPIETSCPARKVVETVQSGSGTASGVGVTALADEPSPLEERRYAQLFTRLQRQRRRVETVMNRDRCTGAEVR